MSALSRCVAACVTKKSIASSSGMTGRVMRWLRERKNMVRSRARPRLVSKMLPVAWAQGFDTAAGGAYPSTFVQRRVCSGVAAFTGLERGAALFFVARSASAQYADQHQLPKRPPPPNQQIP